MRRTKILLFGILILGVVLGTLFYNKSKMTSKSAADLLGSVPVSTARVTRTNLQHSRTFTGTIAANNDVAIIAETEGRVVEVAAKVGDYKPAGAILLRVDDELKKAAYTSAEANYEKAGKDFERFEALHAQHAVTDQQYENARLASKNAEAQFIIARKQYNDTKITTPISGIVTSRLVDVGTMVQNKMPVANVVDISTLKVKLNVAEDDVFRLARGQKAEISTDAYPGVTFAGTIESVSAKSDDAHTYPVEISLPNSKEHPLKAGMFASVAFAGLSDGRVLTVPREALLGSFKAPQVFVVENGAAHLRDIVVSREVDRSLEVLSGLGEGDTVVVNGQNNLKENIPVTVIQ